MSDQNPDLALQEVDEELRRERLNSLWTAYGKYIIAIAIGIIITVAAREIYSSYRAGVEEANSAAFNEAIEAAKFGDSIDVWEKALPNMKEGYAALASLRLAAAYLEDSRPEKAIETYDALANSTDRDEALKGFAAFNAAILVSTVRGDDADARSRFSILAVKGRPWYFSAQEQLAFLDIKAGDDQAAMDKFSILADDPQTPQTIRSRAVQMRDYLDLKLFNAETSDAAAEDVPAPAEENSGETS
ncbi:hypothetical protein GCM10017044_23590 [Kordiimonas sediminis]|uniref:Ancillary SecYEG translocon subunit/Cell division coordinator CpoB TPR domain-containing protein n=1 Tax=Kordiimonas sediminis TaxID=1735581 RepID=A0A919AX88_9PROT|nr:tetratricopeptide repeat protein [Kordiimonas sediminis]GHF27760.1 hypothetical protein GCM10017044_23590 [Kordiimonas sediminis]